MRQNVELSCQPDHVEHEERVSDGRLAAAILAKPHLGPLSHAAAKARDIGALRHFRNTESALDQLVDVVTRKPQDHGQDPLAAVLADDSGDAEVDVADDVVREDEEVRRMEIGVEDAVPEDITEKVRQDVLGELSGSKPISRSRYPVAGSARSSDRRYSRRVVPSR